MTIKQSGGEAKENFGQKEKKLILWDKPSVRVNMTRFETEIWDLF